MRRLPFCEDNVGTQHYWRARARAPEARGWGTGGHGCCFLLPANVRSALLFDLPIGWQGPGVGLAPV